MNTFNFKSLRLTALSAIAAFAVALPATGWAGVSNLGNGAGQAVKDRSAAAATKARENRRLAKLADRVGDTPAMDIVRKVWDMKIKEQFDEAVELIAQIEVDYQYFTGGDGCSAHCATFRQELKGVLGEFLTLVNEVPVLSDAGEFAQTIERVSGLVDHIPPRPLYLMWQALAGKMDELRSTADEIRQILGALPSLQDVSNKGQAIAVSATDAVCDWAAVDKPFVALMQARLEYFAWKLKTTEGLIVDISAKAEVGGEGGIAVANAGGNAGVGLKPTDQAKLALKTIAVIPEQINWTIKLNLLKANAVCAGLDTVRSFN